VVALVVAVVVGPQQLFAPTEVLSCVSAVRGRRHAAPDLSLGYRLVDLVLAVLVAASPPSRFERSRRCRG
jgi:hypothetical protein